MAEPVVLSQPIARGDTTISSVAVRKPTSGALRGLKLNNILTMDVSTMLVLLPRVTEPALLPAEVAALEPVDLLALSAVVVGFFMTPEQAAQVQATGIA